MIQNLNKTPTDKSHILIVDDDNRILKLLKKFLQQNNFLVSTATSAKESIDLLKNFSVDLIILDVMMPEITGIEFAKNIKSSGQTLPIIMLTALSEPEHKIEGLEAGANDYVTKPFEPKELLLRIHNLINTHKRYKKEQNLVRFGNSYYDLNSKDFVKNDKRIKLSSTEQKLLEILIESPETVISREKLSDKMGKLNIRSVDVQIVRLRNKIEIDAKNPKFLKTIRNQGYVLYT
ncbi:MAG: response regulator transcription factor [Rickettsiaceae bacterium]|nr:response regulator transcription factor [Rickettsiaceae bacterium]